MKNTVTLATAGLALSASTGAVTAYNSGGGRGASRVNGQTLAAKRGMARVPNFIGGTSSTKAGLRRLSTSSVGMRDSIVNTHRFYPLGRDSREAMMNFGADTLLDSALKSAEHSASNLHVNQGAIEQQTHTLHDLTSNDVPATGPYPKLPIEGLHAYDHTHDHLPSSLLPHTIPHTLPHKFSHILPHDCSHVIPHEWADGFASVAKPMVHHSSPVLESLHSSRHQLSLDMLREVSLRTGSTPGGKSDTPAVLISGGLTLALLAGGAHGAQVLDQLLMAKLESWPLAYAYAAKVNDALGACLSHIEASGTGHSVRQGLTELIRGSNIETVVDPQDASSLRMIKLNLKPVPGGPTFSVTLSAAANGDRQVGQGIKPKRREFAVDVPGGSLTLTVPAIVPRADHKALNGPDVIPATLSFVEKHSGAELVLGNLDLPVIW